MKKIKYQYMVDDLLYNAEVDWSETNEEIVKAEAYNGEYAIEDDGTPEVKTPEQEIAELKAALNKLLEGLTQ